MQRREQGRFVPGIQSHHKAIQHGERCGHCRLFRLGLSLVDTDGPSPSAGRKC
jgi:hypothetical protein